MIFFFFLRDNDDDDDDEKLLALKRVKGNRPARFHSISRKRVFN